MSMFDDIKLEWQGKAYVIPAQRALEAMSRVEEAITLHELQGFYIRQTLPIAKLVRAYASLLCCAGKAITGEELYAELKGAGAQEGQLTAFIAQILLTVLLPPSLQLRTAQADQEKVFAVGEKPAAGNPQAVSGKASSKPGSNSLSDRDGSPPKHSGPGRRWRLSGSSRQKRRSR